MAVAMQTVIPHRLPFQPQLVLMAVVMVPIMMAIQETLVDLVAVTGTLVILLVKQQTIQDQLNKVILVEHKEEVITGQVAAAVVPVLLVQMMVLAVLLVVT